MTMMIAGIIIIIIIKNLALEKFPAEFGFP